MRVILIGACALMLTASAQGENYGGVTQSQRNEIKRYIHLWFDKFNVGDTMVCIADRESGLNPKAYNDDWAPYRSVAGLFQIEWRFHARHWERNAGYSVGWWAFYRRMTDPVQNIKLAYRLYRTSGLSPWGGGC